MWSCFCFFFVGSARRHRHCADRSPPTRHPSVPQPCTEWPGDPATAAPGHNPLVKLPVLLMPAGGSVYESSYILQWLELKHPDPPLLPPDPDGVLAARRYEVLCDGICDAVVLTFFERQRDEAGRSAPWLARQRRKIEGGLAEIARLLGDRDWTVGDRFTLGDIAAGTVAGYLSSAVRRARAESASSINKQHNTTEQYTDRTQRKTANH
ncbi:glutathione S-transferase C-terminal domain-containing protein, partial [Methylobacterium radiotolerans]|uniref:glutathione S-transferase C-terminal domain-containing protein n=1 Tax=Methylobacterium radiotolerans TaxID=31998 RepID=UPI0024782BEB